MWRVRPRTRNAESDCGRSDFAWRSRFSAAFKVLVRERALAPRGRNLKVGVVTPVTSKTQPED